MTATDQTAAAAARTRPLTTTVEWEWPLSASAPAVEIDEQRQRQQPPEAVQAVLPRVVDENAGHPFDGVTPIRPMGRPRCDKPGCGRRGNRHVARLAANVCRRCRPLAARAILSMTRPQTPCSIRIHTGNVPGSATMTTMATVATIETIRSRR